MSTPHNNAKPGDIAKMVLMPGDPLRAKFISDTFLENPVMFNNVRNMFGYTGTYNGREISVMGSGMGMPSIGIYSYELYTVYGVENIIRIGSAGSYCSEADIYDVVLATSSYSESSYARVQNGYESDITYPSESLNGRLKRAAEQLGIPLIGGCLHSSDVFYRETGIVEDFGNQINDKPGEPYYARLHREKGCVAVEMESFALFHNAAVLGKNASCLVTISDSFVSDKITTAKERETSFTNMMRIALEGAY